MLRFLRVIFLVYMIRSLLVYAFSRGRAARNLFPHGDPAIHARDGRKSRLLGGLGIAVAAISALAATASAVAINESANTAADQRRLAQASVERQAMLDDLQFIGRVAIELDVTTESIRVSNYSNLPLVDVALWTLGFSADSAGGESLDTIRAPLTGLGVCRTMVIPVDTLVGAVAEADQPLPTAEEVYLTFKAPSRIWYTISEATVFERVEGQPQNATEAAGYTYSDYILADTVEEGVDSSRILISVIPIGPIGVATQRATGGVNVSANGCNVPGMN